MDDLDLVILPFIMCGFTRYTFLPNIKSLTLAIREVGPKQKDRQTDRQGKNNMPPDKIGGWGCIEMQGLKTSDHILSPQDQIINIFESFFF